MKFIELNDRVRDERVKRGLNRAAIVLSILLSALLNWVSYEISRYRSGTEETSYLYVAFPLIALVIYGACTFLVVPAVRWTIKGFID